ncbi:MAG: GTPase HflX [Candidatus Bathyarchaeota archaeon]|nr:GTPase HflX [Candidatus Bathyarchaeota archaeon]
MRSLAEAAGYEVVGSLEQVSRPRSRYHVGSGKVKELAEIVSELGAEKIIFGDELKVVQVYNLTKVTGVETIDRFQLILEIFRQRASTREANLQIDLARWQYELAHAREKVRLARISEQPGFLGLGKYEVDVYHETVRRQVQGIQEKLGSIKKTRKLHRHRRRKLGFPLASLAGYTNSGKSTLFNSLTDENVPADSSLFTTLSTTTRTVNLFGENVLLTDTVGFVDKLPLTLVEAFRSTLEETIFSDLILLVVDVSEPRDEIERKMLCCLETIQEIDAAGIPLVTVLNKVDLLSAESLEQRMADLKDYSPSLVPISALNGTNLHLLMKEMFRHLIRRVQSSFTVPVSEESLSLLSWVFDHADVHKVSYGVDGLNVSFGAVPYVADKIRNDVEKLSGAFRHEEMESLRPQVEPQA